MSEKFTEGVGKKIVDALKQQSSDELQSIGNVKDYDGFEKADLQDDFNNQSNDDNFVKYEEEEQPSFTTASQVSFETPVARKDSFASDLDDFEVPANIAVLKQLINQLPSSVSKQTGAQIIKQTMEALGISMKSVLQEAQQLQESITNSTRDCQNSILEYKKQINALEKQSQRYQKQYSALNDIISLFVQTSI